MRYLPAVTGISSPVQVQVPSAGADGLSPEAVARADRAAERIAAELRRFVEALPPPARSASALARHLGIDRTTCQRVVSAISRADVGPQTLTRLPGTQAMRQVVKAARRRGVAEPVLAGLEAAIQHVDDLVREIAGSQSKLAAMLSSSRGAPATVAGGESGAQVRLFEAAAAIAGRWSRVAVSLFIFGPGEEGPQRISRATVTGVVGHEARPDAVPLVLFSGRRSPSTGERYPGDRVTTLDRTSALGRTPAAILSEFSTRPPPVVTARGPGGELAQIIDTDRCAQGPVDVLVGNYAASIGPHPATEDPPLEEVWHMIYYPSRHLLFDVWLHRDMARASIPSADAHLWRPHFDESPGDRWDTRLPEGPRLEVLGPGLRKAGSAIHPRQAELTAHVFGRVGWNPEEFVGYRCAVEYPVWRAGYCMTFDFGGDGAG